MPRLFVTAAHRASDPSPIVGRAGDLVLVGPPDPDMPAWFWCRHTGTGREGWVAEAFLIRASAGEALLARDYDAGEIDVATGEVVEAREVVAGWTWCLSSTGRAGWVPSAKLSPTG